MKRMNWNFGWEIQQGEASRIPMFPANKQPVTLPHDFVIGKGVSEKARGGAYTGYFEGGTVTYSKKFSVPEDWRGQRVLLHFDGVAGYARVLINGYPVKSHHYAYTPFDAELSRHLYYGQENTVSVVVSSDDEPNSRWYLGGGIYRSVELLRAPKLHIAPEGLYVVTDHIVNGDAFVTVEVELENHGDEDACVSATLCVKEEDGTEATCGKATAYVPAMGTATARTQLCIPQAKLWNLDAPALYRLTVRIDGDEAETVFGVRTLSVDSRNGFLLNSEPIKLRGGCVHHDNGILGAVSLFDAEYRKLKAHKDNGFNAVRTAHNPPSKAFLEAADRLGILVLAEAFDVWTMPKNTHDFSQHFEREWLEELTAFIKRDRNHPCIFLWSIGNELPEQGGLSEGYRWSAKLTAAVRALDPSRPVGGALCSFFNGLDDRDNAAFWRSLMEDAQKLRGGGFSNLDSRYGKEIWSERTEAFVAPWDVVGYNYLSYHYRETGEKYPDRVICATESKPGEMAEYWKDVQELPYLIGDFAWTSQDYIGEAGIGKVLHVKPEEAAQAARGMHAAPYPWRTANCGDFDLTGEARPQLAFRRIVWGSKETYLVSHDPANHDKLELLGRYGWPDCQHSWSWNAAAGSPVKVEVYSAAPEVELFLNGESLGKKAPEGFRAAYELAYTPGTLEAVSTFADGSTTRDAIRSAGAPARLVICPEVDHMAADGMSLCFTHVLVTDDDGVPTPYAAPLVRAAVEGKGELLAFGSAAPQSTENYCTGSFTACHGQLLAVLRAKNEAGEIRLRVSAEGLESAEAVIRTEK